MKKSKRKDKKHNKMLDFVLILISSFAFLGGSINIYMCLKNIRTTNEIEYMYNTNSSLDYRVNLYANSFFDEKYLGMNKQYTSKLIKNVDVTFNSSVSASQISNIDYDYVIKATISGTYKSNYDDLSSEIWKKEYILSEDKVTASNVTANNLQIPITIDFQKYKDYVTEFQKQLRLDIDATLNVDLYLNYNIYLLGDSIKINDKFSLNIPLSNPTFKISTKIPNERNETIFTKASNEVNTKKLFCSVPLIIGAILGYSIVLSDIIKKNRKSKYNKNLNKYLKDYGDIIAETVTEPNLSKQEIFDIKNIDDLIDIEMELKIPIILFEVCKGKEAWFILNHNNRTYRFILKDK